MRGNLQSWSWGDIQAIYAILGQQLHEYLGVHQRINVPRADVKYSDRENVFFLRFWGDVLRINSQIACLDAEILRRNRLLGVIG